MSLRRDPRDILISSGDDEYDHNGSNSSSSSDDRRHSSQSSIDLLVREMLRGSRARRPTRREATAMLLRNRNNTRNAHSRSRFAPGYSHRAAIHPTAATMHIDIEGNSSGTSSTSDGAKRYDDARIQRGLASLTPFMSTTGAERDDSKRRSHKHTVRRVKDVAKGRQQQHEEEKDDRPTIADVPSSRAKPRRKPDKAAQARLLHSVASTRAKQQEKYEKRKQKEADAAAAEAVAKRHRHYSAVATEAGRRLYAMARTRAAGLQRLRDEAAEQRKRDEAAVYTFKPVISAEAQRLASSNSVNDVGGYRGPAERSADLAAATRAELELRRLKAQHAELQACTFQPTISPHSRELARQAGRTSHEPFEPGERLYLEGGERLLRGFIRRQLAMDQDKACVVGAGRTLSTSEAAALARRLQAWQAVHDRNLAAMREASLQAVRTSSVEKEEAERRNVTPRIGNSSSMRRSLSAQPPPPRRPHTAEQPASHLTRDALSSYYRRVCTASVPTLHPRTEGSVSCLPPHMYEAHTEGTHYAPLASLPSNDMASGSEAKALQDGLRIIRYGALFYKYAAPTRADVLRLGDVRTLVSKLYPEDAGVLDALTRAVSDEETPMDKNAFVRALALYELANGPQPWGCSEKKERKGASEPEPHTIQATPVQRTSSRQRAASAAPRLRTAGGATMITAERATSKASSIAPSGSEECTFTPRLSRRTRMLSERERRRRQARAEAQPACSASRRATDTKLTTQPLGNVDAKKEASDKPRMRLTRKASPSHNKTPPRATEPSPGHSPSVELSSLSSSERTSEPHRALLRTAPQTRDAAAAELEALLEPCVVLPVNTPAVATNKAAKFTPQLSPVTRTETATPPTSLPATGQTTEVPHTTTPASKRDAHDATRKTVETATLTRRTSHPATRLHPAHVTCRDIDKTVESDGQPGKTATATAAAMPALQGDLAGDFSALYEALYHKHNNLNHHRS